MGLQKVCNDFAKMLQSFHKGYCKIFAISLQKYLQQFIICNILQQIWEIISIILQKNAKSLQTFFFSLQIFATSLQILCCRFPKDNAKMLQPRCKTLQLLSINLQKIANISKLGQLHFCIILQNKQNTVWETHRRFCKKFACTYFHENLGPA